MLTARKPISEPPAERVTQQLDRILSSPPFKASKRCASFLQFVTSEVLNGRADRLKERTIGSEIFGREPGYDTNEDPVVRNTAGEVRKRLAQYYQEAGQTAELRIDLPLGSYIPVFHASAGALAAEQAPVRRRRRRWAAAAAAVLVLVALWLWLKPAPNAADRFWAPVVDASGPVLICVGQPAAFHFNGFLQGEIDRRLASPNWMAESGDYTVRLRDVYQFKDRYVTLYDAICLSRIVALLTNKGKEYRIRGGGSTSFTDLRDSTTVLIGAFTNEWTMKLAGQLRFSFYSDPAAGVEAVRDSQRPGQLDWKLVRAWPGWKIPEDYAIVSRVSDPSTGRIVVTAAGITQYGTNAAGEFVTSGTYMADALRRAPASWRHMNMQAVLATKVVEGGSGPPRVLATHFW